jgi:hypothetical protein
MSENYTKFNERKSISVEFVHSFFRSFVHSFIHSFIHSYSMDPISVTKPTDVEIVKNNRTGHKILKYMTCRKSWIHNILANSKHHTFIHHVVAIQYNTVQYNTVQQWLFLGAFATLWKMNISIIMSVLLLVCMEQLSSHWTHYHEIWYLRIFLKSVEKIQVSLKSDKNSGYLIWIHKTFMVICHWINLRMRDVSDKVVEKINTHLVFNNFFPKTAWLMR